MASIDFLGLLGNENICLDVDLLRGFVAAKDKLWESKFFFLEETLDPDLPVNLPISSLDALKLLSMKFILYWLLFVFGLISKLKFKIIT